MSSCPTGSGYAPSAAVEAFHGIPHADIDLQSSPDQFDPGSRQYWEAVIIWACLPILVCVCLLILMSIYFICVCCCCCCGGSRDWSKKPKICCGITNLTIIGILLALMGVSLWAELSIERHINDGLDNVEDVEDFFNQYSSNSDLYNEAMQNESLNALEIALNDTRPPPPENITEIVRDLEVSNSVLGDVYRQIESYVGPISLEHILDNTDSYLESFRNWVIIGYLCVVMAVLVLLVTAILCGICVKSPVFLIIMVILLVITTLTIWIALGANLAALIILGDVCDDPDTLLRNFTMDQAHPVDTEVVSFYLVCNANCSKNPYLEVIEMADNAFGIIDAKEDQLMNYISNLTTNNSANLLSLLGEVERGFNRSEDGVDAIASCTFVHETYLDTLELLCGDAYDSFVILFGVLCAMSVGMMVLVITVTFHTGFYCNRQKAYDEEAVAFEFPANTGGVWQSYGTHTNFNPTYNRFREQGRGGATSPGAAEPPKFNDLQHPMNGSSVRATARGGGGLQYNEMHETHRSSTPYDHT